MAPCARPGAPAPIAAELGSLREDLAAEQRQVNARQDALGEQASVLSSRPSPTAPTASRPRRPSPAERDPLVVPVVARYYTTDAPGRLLAGDVAAAAERIEVVHRR